MDGLVGTSGLESLQYVQAIVTLGCRTVQIEFIRNVSQLLNFLFH